MRLSLLLLAATAARATAQQPEAPRIADNSFLLEEAYNQERRVVQHISAFQRTWGSGGWAYSFVQEWPLGGQRSQLSFTLPVQRLDAAPAAPTGVGDVAINYRFQLAGGGTDTRTSAAPRFSLLVPTGNERKGFGAGAMGVQVNLPVSVTMSRALVTHWNAGVTLTPSARDAAGARAATTGFTLGASAIWLAGPTVNVLVEVAWTRGETVAGPDQTTAAESWLVNPGIRWAHNFASGLQIVPGVAYPIGIGPSRGEQGLFLYLSFEHPF